jgi:flagella basal body P-ring formation protein FlgA
MSSASFTEMYGRVVLAVFVVAVILAVARAAFAGPAVVTPGDAIEAAVARRVGGGVFVDVASIATRVAPEPGLQAHLERGARAGQPMRVVLTVGGVRRGSAVATVRITGPFARAARAIARDAVLGAADVETVDGEWPSVPFVRLPGAADVIGLTARRDIVPDEPLTATVLDVPPLVRAGDEVTVVATVGAVRITNAATASSSGHRGDTIRVTPENGRPVRARIIGPAAVEVTP